LLDILIITAEMKKRAAYTDTWFHFMEELEQAKNSLGFQKNEECFYRGHAQADWQLCPGLLRGIKPYKKQLITAEYWDIESDLYYEFRSRARVLHNQEMSDWDVLFNMQHHKVKTRLLDWTEMLGTAIYFAIAGSKRDEKANGNTPCIWLMNPYRLNELYHGWKDLWDPENLDFYGGSDESYSELLLGVHKKEAGKMFYWDEPIALYPLRKNDRLTNQGGYFTMHGNNILSLELLPKHQEFLRKVHLPKAGTNAAFDFLEIAGINDFTMFPDLDGLAQYLNKKYFN
jgi:hypothetical protein